MCQRSNLRHLAAGKGQTAAAGRRRRRPEHGLLFHTYPRAQASIRARANLTIYRHVPSAAARRFPRYVFALTIGRITARYRSRCRGGRAGRAGSLKVAPGEDAGEKRDRSEYATFLETTMNIGRRELDLRAEMRG
jgi:hypothetical protein